MTTTSGSTDATGATTASATDSDGRTPTSPFAEYSARLGRELATALVTHREDTDLAAEVARIAAALSAAAEAPSAVVVDDPARPAAHIPFDITPASSPRNPIAPPMDIRWDGERSRCELTLPLQYQGPPGRVHGGIVALLLDHVLGNAANAGDSPRSYTRYLNVQYDGATPIGGDIVIEGWLDREEGRKRFMAGRILVDGQTSVQAEGLWIRPKDPVPAE
ncbi:PaaI family thioesterase [Brevibacterium litoralis]|uniref:PaaI family thioesterase n=1 Tax=Brevibacterium litoralis TaxID=3138935 RepID=UPI0032EAD856